MDNQEVEKEIQEKGLTATRLTQKLIDECVKDKQFYVFPNTQLTVCCLTLSNGFTVIGESSCISPENFDSELGQKIAYSNAKDKIWMLEGYLTKQMLYQREQYAFGATE